MKILLVTDGFYPEISARALRATELAKELAIQGNEVSVITKERVFDIKSFEQKTHIHYRSFGKLRWKEVIIGGGKYQQFLKRGWRRLLILLFEYPLIEIMWNVKSALKNLEGYDLLISFAAPHPIHWGVAWATTTNSKIANKWIADCGDPFMGERADTFRKLFYFKYLEKWFCRKADFITVPVVEAIKAYYPEFRDKMAIIPQGFSFSNIIRAPYKKRFASPCFAFAGSITSYIDSAPPFFDYLIKVQEDFRFILYLKELGRFDMYARELKDKIEIREFIEREQLIFELSQMDFLVNFMYKNDVQRSSKLITYSLAGRPILNINVGCDIESLTKEFLDGDYTRQYVIQDIEQFNITNVAKQFIGLSGL